MKYLLDTNIFIFLIEKNFSSLSKNQLEIFDSSKNELFISEASYFEICIKSRLNKENFSHIEILKLEKFRKSLNIKLLKPKVNYYLQIPSVPKVINNNNKVHGDPFDLLIISQALTEKLSILSSDKLFPLYKGLKVIS